MCNLCLQTGVTYVPGLYTSPNHLSPFGIVLATMRKLFFVKFGVWCCSVWRLVLFCLAYGVVRFGVLAKPLTFQHSPLTMLPSTPPFVYAIFLRKFLSLAGVPPCVLTHCAGAACVQTSFVCAHRAQSTYKPTSALLLQANILDQRLNITLIAQVK